MEISLSQYSIDSILMTEKLMRGMFFSFLRRDILSRGPKSILKLMPHEPNV